MTSASSVPRTASEDPGPRAGGGGTATAPGTRRRPPAGRGRAGPGEGRGGLPGNRGCRAGPDERSHPDRAPRPAGPTALIAAAAGLQGRARRHRSRGVLTPKQRVPAKTPSLSPPPAPPARGFECKQSSRARSVPETGLRTPPVGPGPRAGRAGGWGHAHPAGSPTPQPPSVPYPRLGRTPRRARVCPHQGSRGGLEVGAGARGPGGGPHPCPPRTAADGRAVQRGQGRLSSGAGFPGHPASRAERAEGHGGEIRSHNIGLGPSPPQTFHRGWGSGGSSGARRGSRPRTRLHEGPSSQPRSRASPRPGPLAAGAAGPAPSPRRGRREDLERTTPPPPFPAPRDPGLAREAAPAREGGQSGARSPAASPRAAPASLTVCSRLESLAPPARSAPTPPPRPRAPPRPLRRRPRSRSARRPALGLRAPPRRPPALSLTAATPPLPDVRRGLEGGPRRPAREGLRPAGPLRSPRSVPASSPCPAGRARESRALRGSGGGGRTGAGIVRGSGLTGLSKCLPGPPGLRGRAREGPRGECARAAPGSAAPPLGRPLALQPDCTGLRGQEDPCLRRHCPGFSSTGTGTPLGAPGPAPSSRRHRATPGKDSFCASRGLTIDSPDVQMKGAEGSHAADLPPSEPPVSAHSRS